MDNILTPQNKKNLRMISAYLNSYSEKIGELTIGDVSYDGSFDFDNNVDVKEWTEFNSNRHIPIPEILYPILDKIFKSSQESFDNMDLDTDNISYGNIEFEIDTETQEVRLTYVFYYNEDADTESTTVDYVDDEKVNEIIDSVREVCGDYDVVELNYNGYGDDGYIDGYFEEPFEQVPADVDSYCYDMLENEHEGWELDEGSNGHFIFDLVDRSITLNHTEQIERTGSEIFYEESFAK